MIFLVLTSLAAILTLVAVGYPVLLAGAVALLGTGRRQPLEPLLLSPDASNELPPVTIIVPVHEAALAGLESKLQSLSQLDYPLEKLKVIVAGDGIALDLSELGAKLLPGREVKCISSAERLGKNGNLNRAMAGVDTGIVVFSDADAALDPAAIKGLVAALACPEVGGVTGRLKIVDDHVNEGEVQSAYWSMEDFIRDKEMALLGSVTSSAGQLCAIKYEVFENIPPSATDDLFIALTVVSKRLDFVSVPQAVAFVTPPSRDLRHEIVRRRRIVTRSLGSIYYWRAVFRVNPPYGLCLSVHKILRRLVPIFLVVGFLCSMGLRELGPAWRLLVDIEVVFLILGGFVLLLPVQNRLTRFLRYYTAGAIGTALGVFDFVLGRRRATWD